MHDLTPATHEHALRAALQAEVDGVEPCDCLPSIRARAWARTVQSLPWLFAVIAGIGLGLLLTGLALWLGNQGDPADPPPAPTTTVLEASR